MKWTAASNEQRLVCVLRWCLERRPVFGPQLGQESAGTGKGIMHASRIKSNANRRHAHHASDEKNIRRKKHPNFLPRHHHSQKWQTTMSAPPILRATSRPSTKLADRNAKLKTIKN